ncbi:MAG: ATP-binding cassette domain-containing protein [Clostridia bacterium]|nr:ATP-binding cassette domain-containing protein [Clostridia bacterium]
MITVTNLTKKYGSKTALNNVSFDVKKGEVLGFLGPNGAGKSTAMNIITGYISSTDGAVTVDGIDIAENPIEAKKRIGYLPELPPLYQDMTVWEYLSFVYDLKSAKAEDKKKHISDILDTVRITDVSKRKIANLSKGYRQRVGLAGALIGDPQVLILDEPTVGLDPKQIVEVRNVIKSLGKTKTVILSSHILSEISEVCDRVIIINKGEFVAEDTPENLAARYMGRSHMKLKVYGRAAAAAQILSQLDGVKNVTAMMAENGECSIDFDADLDEEARKNLFFAFAENQMPVISLEKTGATLEDIFMTLTNDTKSGGRENESDI